MLRFLRFLYVLTLRGAGVMLGCMGSMQGGGSHDCHPSSASPHPHEPSNRPYNPHREYHPSNNRVFLMESWERKLRKQTGTFSTSWQERALQLLHVLSPHHLPIISS